MKNDELTFDDLPKLSEEENKWWNEHNDEYIHYFYRIDNISNGKFYYGIHSEKKSSGKSPENDGYMGSGSRLNKAQKEEGMKNFKKTIIKTFSTRDEARLEEMKVVNRELINNDDCYNISLGGAGTNISISYGFVLANYKDPNKRLKQFFMVPKEEYYQNKELYITATTGFSVYKNSQDENDKRLLCTDDLLVLSGQFVGVTKGIKSSGKNKLGEKNGSYGTYWITNGIENKKIKDSIIPDGWYKGRTDLGYAHIKYKNIITGEEREFPSNCIDIPSEFLPLVFFKDNGDLISESEIYEKYNELGNWEVVARFFGRGRRTIEKLRNYYSNLRK